MNKLEERTKNLCWTVAKDYDLNIIGLFDEGDRADEAWAYACSLNGSYSSIFGESRYLDLVNFINKNSWNYNRLMTMAKIGLELYLYDKIKERYLNLPYLREAWAEKNIRDLRDIESLEKKMMMAHYRRILGENSLLNNMEFDLYQDLGALKDERDPNSFMESLKKVLEKHFQMGLYEKKSQAEKSDNKKKNPLIEREKKTINKPLAKNSSDHFDLDMDQEIESAEFTEATQNIYKVKDEERMAERIILTNNLDKRVHVENRFGKSILTDREIRDLEKVISVKNHSGSHVIITRGELPKSLNKPFYEEQRNEARRKNLGFFEDNKNQINRSIRKLMMTIANSLITDLENTPSYTVEGRLLANRVWRKQKLDDSKIFFKEEREEHGLLTVDLLLDGSASQMNRQEKVANQAYILAEAFSLLGIPNRIWSYRSLYEYTSLNLFKDYRDDKRADKNIMNYEAASSNRDGLAIKTISHFINRENRDGAPLLIVLSDGKPNDERGKIDQYRNINEYEYTGKNAIADTSIQIRQARNSGISVLGVFTGKEEDLPAMKLIYGPSFAYIKDIDEFSNIVGLFMKRELRSVLQLD